MRRVYLDHAASAPLAEVARERLISLMDAGAPLNPNSVHTPGREAFTILEDARRDVARFIGARPYEMTFTSGGTESDNMALIGTALNVERLRTRRTVIISAIEHEAVAKTAHALTRHGIEVLTCPVTPAGVVDLEALEALLTPDVSLVSIIAANNEIGTIQPIAEISRLAHAVGALMHTDAVQFAGREMCDVKELGVDLLTITAHKLGGPVGVGALYVKRGTTIDPLFRGGGQERGLRSGTQPALMASAFAAVVADHTAHHAERAERVNANSAHLISRLEGELGITRTVPVGTPVVPGIVSVLVPDAESDSLVLALDAAGYAVSGGSACSSGSHSTSHVLLALGKSQDECRGVLRISFGHETTRDDLDGFVEALASILDEKDR